MLHKTVQPFSYAIMWVFWYDLRVFPLDPQLDLSYWYQLIGVVVHTGTAEGGHYYSFILDRSPQGRDQWFLFNDAEVKPFDPAQIASECFGGEMTVSVSYILNINFT